MLHIDIFCNESCYEIIILPGSSISIAALPCLPLINAWPGNPRPSSPTLVVEFIILSRKVSGRSYTIIPGQLGKRSSCGVMVWHFSWWGSKTSSEQFFCASDFPPSSSPWHHCFHRIWLQLLILQLMDLCLYLSLQGVIRQQSLLQLDIKNIIPYICHLAIFQILLTEHMEMHYSLLPSSLYWKVIILWYYSVISQSHFCIASKWQWKTPLYQKFCCQLYHTCLAQVFCPLKAGMTTPDVVKCPDGLFHWAIYGLGPYIADYPEQVWLPGVIQDWCPKYVMLLSQDCDF